MGTSRIKTLPTCSSVTFGTVRSNFYLRTHMAKCVHRPIQKIAHCNHTIHHTDIYIYDHPIARVIAKHYASAPLSQCTSTLLCHPSCGFRPRNCKDAIRPNTTFIIAYPIADTCFGYVKQPPPGRITLSYTKKII